VGHERLAQRRADPGQLTAERLPLRLRLVAYFGEQLGKSRVGGAVIVIAVSSLSTTWYCRHKAAFDGSSSSANAIERTTERSRRHLLDRPGAQLPQRLLQLAMVRSPHARPPVSEKSAP